jgi:hypothetical protein
MLIEERAQRAARGRPEHPGETSSGKHRAD